MLKRWLAWAAMAAAMVVLLSPSEASAQYYRRRYYRRPVVVHQPVVYHAPVYHRPVYRPG